MGYCQGRFLHLKSAIVDLALFSRRRVCSRSKLLQTPCNTENSIKGFDKSDFCEVFSIHSKCQSWDQKWISEKRSGLDIFRSNLIPVNLTDFRSWQEITSFDKPDFYKIVSIYRKVEGWKPEHNLWHLLYFFRIRNIDRIPQCFFDMTTEHY